MRVDKKWKLILVLILLWMILLHSPTSILKVPFTKGKPQDFHWGYYWDNCLIILCSNAMINGSASFYKGWEIVPETASLSFLHLPLKKKPQNETLNWMASQFVEFWSRIGTTGCDSHGVPGLYVIYDKRTWFSAAQPCLLFKFSVFLSNIAERSNPAKLKLNV